MIGSVPRKARRRRPPVRRARGSGARSPSQRRRARRARERRELRHGRAGIVARQCAAAARALSPLPIRRARCRRVASLELSERAARTGGDDHQLALGTSLRAEGLGARRRPCRRRASARVAQVGAGLVGRCVGGRARVARAHAPADDAALVLEAQARAEQRALGGVWSHSTTTTRSNSRASAALIVRRESIAVDAAEAAPVAVRRVARGRAAPSHALSADVQIVELDPERRRAVVAARAASAARWLRTHGGRSSARFVARSNVAKNCAASRRTGVAQRRHRAQPRARVRELRGRLGVRVREALSPSRCCSAARPSSRPFPITKPAHWRRYRKNRRRAARTPPRAARTSRRRRGAPQRAARSGGASASARLAVPSRARASDAPPPSRSAGCATRSCGAAPSPYSLTRHVDWHYSRSLRGACGSDSPNGAIRSRTTKRGRPAPSSVDPRPGLASLRERAPSAPSTSVYSGTVTAPVRAKLIDSPPRRRSA